MNLHKLCPPRERAGGLSIEEFRAVMDRLARREHQAPLTQTAAATNPLTLYTTAGTDIGTLRLGLGAGAWPNRMYAVIYENGHYRVVETIR